MKYKLYEVGGRVRDFYLGLDSKDIDYSVVIEDPQTFTSTLNAFYVFRDELLLEGYTIYQEYPDSFTIKAGFPKDHLHSGAADFVIARKELGYIEGTRQPIVKLGSILDDLKRRDFTVNAMTFDDSDNLFDPLNGMKDLRKMVLRTPEDPNKSLSDDPLRILRAFRFCVTKGFSMSPDLERAIKFFEPNLMDVVSVERIREELDKMFMHDTIISMEMMYRLKMFNAPLYVKIMSCGIRLQPTLKKK
jgi:tRNA nucleotidyltransferase/poly(A) polymerase